jgi:hypothetical protein
MSYHEMKYAREKVESSSSTPPPFHSPFLSDVSHTEAGISKNYCAKNSGLPEVELRFSPWLILNWAPDLRTSLCPYDVFA